MATMVSARLSTAGIAGVVEKATIWYEPAVLESMRQAAQSAFDADGQPLLGLLLGRKTPIGLSCKAWVPALSDSSRDFSLRRAIALAKLEYPAESPIGWFRSKHQGEARLSTDELLSTSYVIPSDEVLALVLRPSGQRPMRLASYLTAAGQQPMGERPLQEFFIHPGGAGANSADVPPLALAALPVTVPLAPPPPRADRFAGSVENLRWALPAGLLVLIAVAGLFVSRMQPEDQLAPLTVSAATVNPSKPALEPLRVSPNGAQWTLSWQPTPSATAATLRFSRDGHEEKLDLSKSQYVAGSYSIPKMMLAQDLDILLHTEGTAPEASDIRARVVGSATAPKPDPAVRQLERVRQELQEERVHLQVLKKIVESQAAALAR